MLEQVQEGEFRVKFDWPDVPEPPLDEHAPLGSSAEPKAMRPVGAAVANDPTSSRQSWLRKVKQSPGALRPEVRGAPVRDDRGCMRIGSVDLTIDLGAAPGTLQHFDRCQTQFEDSCVVTKTVRHGIPRGARRVDPQGKVLLRTGDCA
jgi:hypothetical protein